VKDDAIEDSINKTIEDNKKRFPQLLRRIKNGKRWLVNNRLEVLRYNNMESQFNFNRWIKNYDRYQDLFEEGYKKEMVSPPEHDLFNPKWIEDLIPMLKKIFPKKRFEDALDN